MVVNEEFKYVGMPVGCKVALKEKGPFQHT
jgi:hypothetical protein